ncbi:MAG: siphovirus Gp157 family protein [archaeon]|nr:siphovirus Gp157 family protein [archaeon]
MANIFEIKNEIADLFNQIEENYGELTPELEEALTIKREEFTDKIKGYSDYVKSLNIDIDAIDTEIARLKELKDSKKKAIDRLEKVMADAIMEFGNTSKSGSKFVDWGTGKASIRITQSVDINEYFIERFNQKIKDFYERCSILQQIDSLTEEDIQNACNNPDLEDDNLQISVEDLKYLDIDFDVKLGSLSDMINSEKGRAALKAILDYDLNTKMKVSVSKSSIKADYKETGNVPEYATIKYNKNVTIK